MDRSSSAHPGSPRVLRAARMSAPVAFSQPEPEALISNHFYGAARSSSPPMPPLEPRGRRVSFATAAATRRARDAAREATAAASSPPPAAAAAHSAGTRRSARKRKAPELLEPSPEPSSRKRKATPEAAKKPPPKKKRATGRLKSDPDSNENEENCDCCICMTEPEPQELATINGCEHYFCFECIEKWADRENTCPLCKKRFSKIDRVHKPKRQKGIKGSVKVKDKSQRSELTSSLALEGLFGELGRSGIAFESFFARLGSSRFNTQIARIVVGGSMAGPPHHGLEPGGPMTRAARAGAAASSRGAASAGPRSSGLYARASPETAARLEAAGVPSLRVSRFGMFGDDDDEDEDSSDDDGGFFRFANSIRSMDSMRGRSTTFSFSGMPGMHAASRAPPARSYASNVNDATAGASADNALEIEDSDDDDGEVEVVQVRRNNSASR